MGHFSRQVLWLSSFFVNLLILAGSKGGRELGGLFLYYLGTLFFFYKTVGSLQFFKTKCDRPLLSFLLVCALSGFYSLIAHRLGGIYLATLCVHALNFYLIYNIKDEEFTSLSLKFIEGLCLFFGLLLFIFYFKNIDVKTIFPNENLLAALLNCGLMIALARGQSKEGSSKLSLVSIPLLCLAQIILASRGGTIAFILTLLLFLLLDWKRALRPIEILLGVLILTLIFIPQSLNGVLHSFTNALGYDRMIIWKGAIQAFLERPIWGWGLGNFGSAYQLHKFPIESEFGRFEKTTSFAHNEFLDVLVQMGIIGFIFYCWLIFTIIYASIVTLKEKKEDWKPRAAALSILVLVLHSFFDFVFHLPILLFLLFSFMAIILNRSKETKINGSFVWIKKFLIPAMGLVGIFLISHLFTNAGHCYQNNNQKGKAIASYLWAHRLNPFYADPMEELSSLTEGKDQEIWIKKTLKIQKYRDDLQERLARIYINDGRIEEAVHALKKAIELNPKFPFYYSELADIYYRLGQHSNALEFYKKAISIEPLYSLAHFQLGILYLEQGTPLAAKNYFQNVVKIEEAKIKSDSPYIKRLCNFDATQARRILEKMKND